MRAATIIVHPLIWVGLLLWSGWQLREAHPSPAKALADVGVMVRQDVVYRWDDGRHAILDVYTPVVDSNANSTQPRRPAVLAIHGGSWRGGSITAARSDPENTIVRLARSGIVVVAIDYRLARPASASWPSVVDDLREAVRWMRRHSNELGIDSDRIAALGQSSGAHLAMILGSLPDDNSSNGISSRVQAVVSFYGPSDLVHLMQTRRLPHEPARVLLGMDTRSPSDAAIQASPIHHVTSDTAPMLFLHGSDDAWVAPDQSSRIAKALERAGVPCRLIVVPAHATDSRPRSASRLIATCCPKFLPSWKMYGMFRTERPGMIRSTASRGWASAVERSAIAIPTQVDPGGTFRRHTTQNRGKQAMPAIQPTPSLGLGGVRPAHNDQRTATERFDPNWPTLSKPGPCRRRSCRPMLNGSTRVP